MNDLEEEVVLELRQLGADTLIKKDDNGDIIAGDYSVPVGDYNLTLDEGSSMVLKSAFIDSVSANSGKIHINEEDATIKITFGYYLLDWGFGKATYTTSRLNKDGHTSPEGKTHYLTKRYTEGGGGVQMVDVTNLLFSTDGNFYNATDCQFFLQYENQQGQIIKVSFEIKQKKIKQNADLTFNIDATLNNEFEKGSITFPLRCKKDTFKADTDGKHIGEMQKSGVTFVKAFSDDVPAGNDTLEPVLVSVTRTIPTGDYEPQDLASAISRAFTNIKATDADYVQGAYTDNALLTTSQAIKADVNIGNGTDPFFVAIDKSNVLQYQGAENFWVGSSQFGLIFDDGDQKFKLVYHSHIFDEHGLSVIKSVGANTNPSKRFYANKNGGIYLNGMSPKSLWEDKLGFNIAKMTVDKQEPEHKTIGDVTANMYALDLEDGRTMTGDLVDLSTVIQKTITADVSFDQPLLQFGGSSTSETDFISIDAENSLDSSKTDNTAYYKIEVRGGVRNKILGASKSNDSILGIVSRYYSTDSYTSTMDSSGSIVYQHKGEPLQLDGNLNVRILTPDNELATDLGTDNTIFLSVMKKK